MQVGGAKALHTRNLSSGVDLTDPELAEAWRRVKNGTTMDNDNYCLFTYSEPKKIRVLASGSDGLRGLSSHVNPTAMLFGAIRVVADGRIRFLSVFFSGEDIGRMQKGQASMHKNAINNTLDGICGEISGLATEEFDEASIRAKIVAACNSSNVTF